MGGLAGLVHGLSFFVFYLINRGGRPTASVKGSINHDLLTEVVGKTMSVNAFCPSWLRLL
jgi:hypothetical protein